MGESGIFSGNRSRDTFHPLCLNSAQHWHRLQRLHPRIDTSFSDRARTISWISPFTAALHAAERRIYSRSIAATALKHPPVFVIGHWRSGTTLLHNLLTRDPQFGFISLFQTLAPGAFLVGRHTLKPMLALRAPATRPMDNVPIHMSYPSEEEFALAHMCPQSPYLGWYFPNDFPELFGKFGLMDRIAPDDRFEWSATYRELLAKASIASGGRQLVLKNPVNTCRVRVLMDIFPGAKFIHIHRNPYDVFPATLHMFREVLKTVTLQEVSDTRIRDVVLDFYPRMMNAYWEQCPAIPGGDHAEIRYDDLVATPLAELERVYGELDLPGWRLALPRMERFLKPRDPFQKNEYIRPPEHVALVDEHWGSIVERLGYERTPAPPTLARA